MKKINFIKMVASGNDFVIIDRRSSQLSLGDNPSFARKVCDRKLGAGADGLLLLDASKKADFKMRIFNADGSQAEMCGNGARCAAFYAKKKALRLDTLAGIIQAQVTQKKVRVELTDPKQIKLDLPLKIDGRIMKVNFINTGVPHTVIFTHGLGQLEIAPLGRLVRFHMKFRPRGTNVNFVEVIDEGSLRVRTYERGVEDETLACGTGSVAAALIFSLKGARGEKINILTRSGETLKVYFKRKDNTFSNVWLEGRSRIVYKGVYYV